jgi:hypothetical protein
MAHAVPGPGAMGHMGMAPHGGGVPHYGMLMQHGAAGGAGMHMPVAYGAGVLAAPHGGVGGAQQQPLFVQPVGPGMFMHPVPQQLVPPAGAGTFSFGPMAGALPPGQATPSAGNPFL